MKPSRENVANVANVAEIDVNRLVARRMNVAGIVAYPLPIVTKSNKLFMCKEKSDL